ncbi:uncharacterized protein [Apostichopus japonicus]|uniref:uncharacterized protein isoform X2 n=1 Tax=Stichopus japonicus TaxID=307972 RepID=UPI003AB7EAB9
MIVLSKTYYPSTCIMAFVPVRHCLMQFDCLVTRTGLCIERNAAISRRLKFNILKSSERSIVSKSSPGIFTPASKGVEVPFVIKPDLNLDVCFGSQLDDLKLSIQARKQNADLTEMIKVWKNVQELEEMRAKIETDRRKNRTRAKDLSKKKIMTDSKDVKGQREEGKRLREDLKKVNAEINSLLDRLYPLALSLPNQLHPDVAIGTKNRIITDSQKTFSEKRLMTGKRDESISEEHPLVQEGTCYLQADAPHTEQRILDIAEDFLTQKGFTPLSCPDMVKQYALDALGQDFREQREAFFVDTKESEMCLTGLSPLSFYVYYMMSVLESNDLPERCFSIGRSYNANYVSEEFKGLHQQYQGNQVQFLCLFENSYQEEEAFYSNLLETLTEFYTNLGITFRVVEIASENLLSSVYRQNAIQIWLPSIQNFVDVGHLTSCCDFVSRRLMIKYPAKPTQTAAESRIRKYPYSIHGTMVKCNVLLDHLQR